MKESTPLLVQKKGGKSRWVKPVAIVIGFTGIFLVGGTFVVWSMNQYNNAAPGSHVDQGVVDHGIVDLDSCGSYDDDFVYPMHRPATWYQKSSIYSSTCTADDYLSYCVDRPPWKDEDEPPMDEHYGARVARLCRPACKDETSSFFMPCMWEAVARLPEVCEGSFEPYMPLPTHTRHSDEEIEATREKQDHVDLYACDEHAVCSACAPSNEYCTAVAEHYGTLRDPDLKRKRRSGASVALRVLNEDFEFWCGQFAPTNRTTDMEDESFREE